MRKWGGAVWSVALPDFVDTTDTGGSAPVGGAGGVSPGGGAWAAAWCNETRSMSELCYWPMRFQ